MKVRGLIKDPDAYNDPPRPFFEHIVALRSCIMNAAIAWVICCIIVGVFSPTVLKWLQAPADALQAAGKIKIVSLNLTGGFSQIMSIGMWGGTALAFQSLFVPRNGRNRTDGTDRIYIYTSVRGFQYRTSYMSYSSYRGLFTAPKKRPGDRRRRCRELRRRLPTVCITPNA